MKIIRLTAENVKRLKVVDITPKGDYVEITGKNGSGKTSVLDTIFWTLAGERNIQEVPLRRGADKGFGRVDLGSIIVERKFTAKGTTSLKVTNAEGAIFPSPQAILDDLFSRFTFDPLAFTKKKPREQYEELRAIAKVSIDIDALEAANKADYDKRTEANRRAKELKARADGGFKFEHPQSEPISIAELTAAMEAASQANARSQHCEWALSKCGQETEALRAAAIAMANDLPSKIETVNRNLEISIAKLRDEAEKTIQGFSSSVSMAKRKLEESEKHLANLEQPKPHIDLSEFRKKIETAQRINRECELRKDQADLIELAKAAEAQSAKLTAAMEAREQQKREALESAEMPIPGISLGAGVVLFDGLPLEQASDAQQLCISTAIAMAANPKLRVIRIRDGSLLDDDLRALLMKMANENDYQLWVERVDSTGQIGIVMEDGEVAADHQEAGA